MKEGVAAAQSHVAAFVPIAAAAGYTAPVCLGILVLLLYVVGELSVPCVMVRRRCRHDDCNGSGSGPGGNQGCLTRLSSFDDAMLMDGDAAEFPDVPGDSFGMLLDEAAIPCTPAAASSAMDVPHGFGNAGRSRADALGADGSFGAGASDPMRHRECAARQSMSGERLYGGMKALERAAKPFGGSLTVFDLAHGGAVDSGACSVGSVGAGAAAPSGGLASVYAMSPA